MSRWITAWIAVVLGSTAVAAPVGDTRVPSAPLPQGAVYRLGSPRLRHGEAAVICCAFSPDGKVLASVGNDKLGKLWDVATGRLLVELKGHTAGVQGVVFTPDGKHVLTASLDMTLKLWDAVSGKEVRTFRGHTAGILPVAISPDGKFAVSEGQEEVVRLWDLATGKEIRTFPGHSSQGTTNLAFAPDSKTLATAGNDYAVRLWDVATGKELKQFPSHQDDVNSLEFSADGKFLITASSDKHIRYWSVTAGKEVRTLTGHTGMVSTVRFCPDGKQILSGGTDKKLILWDLTTGKVVRRFAGHRSTVSEVVVTPDGKIAATAGHDGTLRLWDVATGQELPQSGGLAETADLAPDGKLIATAGGGTVRFFDASSGKALPTTFQQATAIVRVVFAGTKTVVTLGEEGDVKIWDLATGKIVKELAWPRGNPNPPQIEPPGPFAIHSLSVSADSKLVIAAGIQTATTWDGTTGKNLERPFMNEAMLQGRGRGDLVVSRDGRLVATIAGEMDKIVVRTWDATTGQELRGIAQPSPELGHLSLAPDGRTLVVATMQPAIQVLETATGLERARLPNSDAAVLAGAISSDGRLAAVADQQNVIRVYDVLNAREIARYPGHAAPAAALTFFSDGKKLMSLATDATVVVWDLAPASTKLPGLPAKLDEKVLAERWAELGGDDGVKAMAAIFAFVGAAEQAVPFFREHLGKTEVQENVKKIPQLIRDLDADDFVAREKATRDLERLGRLAEPAMRGELGRKPPLEVKLRLERILEKLKAGGGSPQELQAIRAVEALEKIDDAGARKLLKSLADGPGEAVVTREAQAALERLR